MSEEYTILFISIFLILVTFLAGPVCSEYATIDKVVVSALAYVGWK